MLHSYSYFFLTPARRPAPTGPRRLANVFLSVSLLTASLLAGAPTQTRAQTLAWQAAQALNTTAPGTGYSVVTATAAGGAGNVYLAGYFNASITLGSTTLATGSGSNAAFVAKWSTVTSSFVWARQVGSTYDSRAAALAVQGSSVYVAGSFVRTATFGTQTLSGTGAQDTFVAKLVDAGTSATFAWAQAAGNGDETLASGLAVSGSSVYVAGTFLDASNTKPAHFGATILSSAGAHDGFVAKLTDNTSSASFTWAQRLGGTNDDDVSALASTNSALYVGGSFRSQPASFGAAALSSAGEDDAFVARLTDAGATASFAWAQRAGGPDTDAVYALAASGSSVYATGSFASTGASFGSTTLSTAGAGDVFVAKLTDAGTSGSFTWAQRAGGLYTDEGTGLAVSGSSVYVAGNFNTAPATFGSTTLTSAGGFDIFAAQLTDAVSTGSFAEAVAAGGQSGDFAYGVALGGSSVYVGGSVFGTTAFGAYPVVGSGYPSGGFVAVLRPGALAATPASVAAPAARPWPNPAHGSTTVALSAGPAGTVATLTLLDARGCPVRRQAATTGAAPTEVIFSLTGVAPGVYTLRVAAGATTTASRLVVE